MNFQLLSDLQGALINLNFFSCKVYSQYLNFNMDQSVIANLEFAKATDEIWKNISKKLDDLENQSPDVPQRIVGRSYRDFKFNNTPGPGHCQKPKITNQNLLKMFCGKSQNLLDTDKEKNQELLDMDIAKNQNLLVMGNQMVKNQIIEKGTNQNLLDMKNQTLMFGIETEKNHNLLNMGKLRDLDMEKEQILLDMDHMLNK